MSQKLGSVAKACGASKEPAVALTLPSDLSHLALVRRVVEEVCDQAHLGAQTRFEMVMAVNEACENVIKYAHGGRPELPFTLECQPLADGLEVRLHDQGQPFDFDAEPELDPTAPRPGGRGVLLIRRLVDRVSCEHPAEGGNVFRLFKQARAA
jgi:anti-sigma regulatory factor (Ser/Thr protein kinase)